jgi:acetylornithine deacetylase
MTSPTQLLADLVRLPSVNPMGRIDLPPDLTYEGRVTDLLEARLRDLGGPCQRQPVAPGRANLVARYDAPSPAPFTAVFEAHQDTVPADAMTVEPFGARVENGRLYGRGACDVKGGIAAMFAVFARLVNDRPKGSANVVLAFTVDEEHTFLGVQELVRSGLTADYAVVAEPTNLRIVNAHKGVARWFVDTPGRACHSSRPDQGVNAIYRMGRLLGGIEAYAEELRASRSDPRLGPPTLSVGRIDGGVSANTVPDRCRIEVDRRLLPGENPAAAPRDLEAFLRRYPGIDFPFSVSDPWLACPSLPADGSGELVARLGAAIDAVRGPHEVIAVPYGTDASTIAEAGVPAVVFGPGDIAQAHTCDEWIDLAELDLAAEILYRFARGSG